MGCGSFSVHDYATYCVTNNRSYDVNTGRASGQFYTAHRLNENMNPKHVIRECVNTEEHPNTIPVILGLDVTGSMGSACKETAQALGKIVKTLYDKYKDVEILVMGIGDFDYDDAPLQVGQYESDVRIADDLDKIYFEGGGGGNSCESYSAAWYFGLHHTKLDCFDKQGRKGIIITMGDEPLNDTLSKNGVTRFFGDSLEKDVKTNELYKEASKKFDIFHIAVDDIHDCYDRYEGRIKDSFGNILGQRLVVSTIEKLSDTICECISASIEGNSIVSTETLLDEQQGVLSSEISW